jgi:hypothetical protein
VAIGAEDVDASLNRAELLSRGAKGGTALLLAGSFAAALAAPAEADAVPDDDLAYARLLVGAELLAADFYGRAIAAKHFTDRDQRYLKRALFNEQEHYQSVAGILSGAGQAPAVAADFDFSYPRDAFTSKTTIAKLGVTLETAFLGAYLGAVDSMLTDALKQPVARIAASEAQHLSVFTELAGSDPFGISFPSPLTIEQASDVLDAYTS